MLLFGKTDTEAHSPMYFGWRQTGLFNMVQFWGQAVQWSLGELVVYSERGSSQYGTVLHYWRGRQAACQGLRQCHG